LKVAVVGAKIVKKEQVLDAIQASTFKIDSFITAEGSEIDNIVHEYAQSKKLEVESYGINWNDLSGDNVSIAINKWNKEYNKNAPANRTAAMVDDCDAMIIIDDNEIEANQCKRKIESSGKPSYVYSLIRKSFAGVTANTEGYIYEF